MITPFIASQQDGRGVECETAPNARTIVSRPFMPGVAVTLRGAKNSTTPRPMLNQPSARASRI